MSGSEWFIDRIRVSLVAPRAFAVALAREHFGLAGILVALAAGASLSLGLDLLVIGARDLDPSPLIGRLVADAVFVAVRVAVLVSLLGLVGTGVLRVFSRGGAPTLDQLVTAVAFALTPFLLVLPAALLVTIAPLLGGPVAILGLAIAARMLYGLAVHLRGLVPLPATVVAFALIAGVGTIGLADQADRGRYVTYGFLPQLAPPLGAAPAEGTSWTRNGMALVVPAGWRVVASTTAGELGLFETDRDVLTIRSARGSGLLTAGDLADQIGLGEIRGMIGRTSRREVVRIGERVVVDDRHVGTYEGRRIALRQLTTVSQATAFALVFRSIEPADVEAALAEDASIAVTWRLGVAP